MSAVCNEIVGDIEDLIQSQEIEPKIRYSYRKNVTARALKKKSSPELLIPREECDSIIPGTQTIFIKTWGCTHNTSDSEYMAGQLQSYGYHLTGETLKLRFLLHNYFCLLLNINKIEYYR